MQSILKENKECGLAFSAMDCHTWIMEAAAAPFC